MVTPRKKNHPKNYNLDETNNVVSEDENSVYYVHVNPLKVEIKVSNQNF